MVNFHSNIETVSHLEMTYESVRNKLYTLHLFDFIVQLV